jgi:hypothetical protein
MVGADLPELRAVCVWVCDAEEGEDRDDEQELDHEEAVHGVGIAPVPGDEESRHACLPVWSSPIQSGMYVVSSGLSSINPSYEL